MELTRKLLSSSSLTLADQRLVKVICSTSNPDRMGDVIIQSGIDLTAYRDNPVVLWGHSQDVPIARAVEIDVKDGKLQATVQFPPEGDDEDSDWVYGKIKAGIVNATSVGFIPRDYEPLDSKQPWGGFKFIKSELLEFSFVSVPANSGCLIVGRSLFNGVNLPLLPSLAKNAPATEDQDGDETVNGVRVPRNILEELFRQAKTPRAMRAKYLAKAEAESWKVGASRDLPTDNADGWDGPAASKRMLDEAGFDGETPDASKAARGFLIHDTANPTLRGSYKFPFADIVGGTLKAVKGGVHAAATRLNDAPSDLQGEMKAIIDGYEKKFGSAAPAKAAGDMNTPTGEGPIGNCGRDPTQECGMKDPAQCMVHFVPPDPADNNKNIAAPVDKAGRRISSANVALLQTAMDHHASATECIKTVLDSNAAADPDGDGDNGDGINQPGPVHLAEEDAVTKRKREAQALIASAKAKH